MSNPAVIDYIEPLLQMKRLVKEYEDALRERQWDKIKDMGAELVTQARILALTTEVQMRKDMDK